MFSPNMKWGVVVLIVCALSVMYNSNLQAVQLSNSLLQKSVLDEGDPLDISDWIHLKKPQDPLHGIDIKTSLPKPIFHREKEIDGEQWTDIIKPEQELVHFNNYTTKETVVTANGVYDNGKEILLVGVHGTNSTTNGFGADMNYKCTQGLVKYARDLSDKHKMPVRLMAFQWSGKLNESARKEAGSVLAQYIKDQLNDSDKTVAEIHMNTHSHGGNVGDHAAQKVFQDCQRSIDCMIKIASPTSDLIFSKKNFPCKKMYNLYGSADTTQGLGSFFSRFNWNRKIHVHNERVHNIRLMNGNKELDHVNIKGNVMENITKIKNVIERDFLHYRDLQVSLNEQTGDPLVTIRHKKINNPDQTFNEHIHAQGYSVRNNAEFKKKFGHDMSEQFGGKHKTWLQKVYNRARALVQEIRSARDKSIK